MYNWAEELPFAITICDLEGKIVYMNNKSKATFAKHGDLIGKNLVDCHKAASWDKIQDLLKTGSKNVYTIDKEGVKKIIYQSPWYIDGEIKGLIAVSMIIPSEMPHYVR